MDNYIAMILLARFKKNIDLSIEVIPVTPKAIKSLLGFIEYSIAKEG